MPLKQTLLGFGKSSSTPALSGSASTSRHELSRAHTASSETLPCPEVDDTIVVASNTQLLTPEDSATDASSQSSQALQLKKVHTGSGRRVTRVSSKGASKDCLVELAEGNEETSKSRNVSGETLVNSPSSILKSGIAALDLPWNMSSIFKSGSQVQLAAGKSLNKSEVSLQSEAEGAGDADAERAARIRATKEKNEQERVARIKAADAKATRRSSRVTLLEKASDVAELAASSLGKRSRDAVEKGMDKLGELKRRASTRPKSMLQPSTTPSFEGPTTKKRRLSEADAMKSAAEVDPVKRKPVPRAKNKRWLTSGLYTGQHREFDARFTGSKNQRRISAKHNLPRKENKTLPLPMFAGERTLEKGRDFKLPFDVFSPLPPGQPKPDEWRKTNKNVFIGDAASEWRTHKFEEVSRCMCTEETKCDENCQNRFMFYECDEKNCNLRDRFCGNRSFHDLQMRKEVGGKYRAGVEVIKTDDRGYGVRSNRTFNPNQVIVEYTGEIITQYECERRMRTIYKDNECYYLMLFDQNMIIDATRGSIARFVNHSCEPNCRMEKWTVRGKPRMALFAGEKGIMTGDELTYDYNFDPFSQKNVQECRCGADSCRGVLGPRVKDERKPKDVAEGVLAGAKRKMKEVLDDSTSRLNKKNKVSASPALQVPNNTKTTKARISSTTRIASGKVTKKTSSRSLSLATGRAIARRPSTLKRLVEAASKRAPIKKGASPKRITSSSSDTGMLSREPSKRSERPVSRRDSVKAAASTMKRSVVRTVRGGASGKERSMRVIED